MHSEQKETRAMHRKLQRGLYSDEEWRQCHA